MLLVGVFDVLAYTDKDCTVPFTWMESDPKLIANPQMVKLHSFDTKVKRKRTLFLVGEIYLASVVCFIVNLTRDHLQIHKVDTLVSYKNDDWDEP